MSAKAETIYPVGGLIAAVLSFISNQSIGWAIIHFCFSWIYVGYWLFVNWDGKW